MNCTPFSNALNILPYSPVIKSRQYIYIYSYIYVICMLYYIYVRVRQNDMYKESVYAIMDP